MELREWSIDGYPLTEPLETIVRLTASKRLLYPIIGAGNEV